VHNIIDSIAVEHYAYVYYNNMRPHSANIHLTSFEKRFDKIRSCCYKIVLPEHL